LFGPKLATAEVYDPQTGTWSATGAMAAKRHGHAAVLLPTGKVLVAGGYDSDRLASAELYDPATGAWTSTGPLPERFYTQIVELLPDGRVLLAGGDVPSGPGAAASAHAALYDIEAGTWTAAQPMLQPRLGGSHALLPDGQVLVAGGQMSGAPDNISFRTAEVYDPVTGTWTATPDMPETRSQATAILLRDGRVLVVGGVGDGLQVLASAELFELTGGS
jgi:N-acetylneuraminic acid mutarotase